MDCKFCNIRIKDADRRHGGFDDALLSARLAQQGGGLEDRRRVGILVRENWRQRHARAPDVQLKRLNRECPIIMSLSRCGEQT
jgi:hypothetical protein